MVRPKPLVVTLFIMNQYLSIYLFALTLYIYRYLPIYKVELGSPGSKRLVRPKPLVVTFNSVLTRLLFISFGWVLRTRLTSPVGLACIVMLSLVLTIAQNIEKHFDTLSFTPFHVKNIFGWSPELSISVFHTYSINKKTKTKKKKERERMSW